MMADQIPAEEALRFILEQIDSVPHLEVLLLLHRSEGRRWTASELAARAYVGEETGEQILRDLCTRNLVDCEEDQYFRDPGRADQPMVAQVSELYRTNLVRVATLIHSKGSVAARQFARAFRFKKEGE